MRPLVFVWPYAVAFWFVFLWAFSPEWQIIRKARARLKTGESKDDRSLRVIAMGMQFSSLVAFVLPFVLGPLFELGNQVVCFWSGVFILLCGSLLRRHCWRMLGEYFTGEVSAKPDQPVISAGAYKLIRHPSYTAGILMMTGIGLSLGNWVGLLFLIVTTFGVYIYRIRLEEQALVEALGSSYISYIKTTKRLVPFLF